MRSVATPDTARLGQSVNRSRTLGTGTAMSHPSDLSTTVPSDDYSSPGSLRVEEPPFALVPEWVIDLDVSDAAFRVYSLLLRYGNTSGQRMPSRKLLAVRLHRSVDAIDRAVREVADTGLVRIEHRRAGRQNLTNRYHLTTTDPHGSRSTSGQIAPPHRPHPRSTPTPRWVRAADLRVSAHSRPPPTRLVAAVLRGGWPQNRGPTQETTQDLLPPTPRRRRGPGHRGGGRRTSSPAAPSPTSTCSSTAAATPGRHWTSRPGDGPATP